MSQPANASRHPLRNRSYVVFLLGSIVSWVGDWIDLAALNWAVLAMNGAPMELGLINACRLVPVFVLSIPAGLLADRCDRRRLLMWLQLGLMLMTFVVGGLFSVGAPFWAFAVAVTLRSSLAAMVLPTRNALLANLVESPALGPAVAIQTASTNLSRIAGSVLVGWLLVAFKTEVVFWINGASYLVVMATTYAASPITVFKRLRPASMRTDLGEAIGYVWRNRQIRWLMMLAIIPMVFGFPYSALMPLFAKELYGVGPEGFGVLLSSSAVGALVGAIGLSFFTRYDQARVRLLGAVLILGLALIFCATISSLWLAAVGMFVVGWSSQSYRTLTRIALQAEVPDQLRGRVLSIALLDRGFIPLGVMMLSMIAALLGPQVIGFFMGGPCVLLAMIAFVVHCTSRDASDMAK